MPRGTYRTAQTVPPLNQLRQRVVAIEGPETGPTNHLPDGSLRQKTPTTTKGHLAVRRTSSGPFSEQDRRAPAGKPIGRRKRITQNRVHQMRHGMRKTQRRENRRKPANQKRRPMTRPKMS